MYQQCICQFLHRAASACFNPQGKEVVLLYQLFYDSQTVNRLLCFECELSGWANALQLSQKGMKFYIAEIEIDENNSAAIKSNKKSAIFLDMKTVPQYSFNSVVCKDGYLLKTVEY